MKQYKAIAATLTLSFAFGACAMDESGIADDSDTLDSSGKADYAGIPSDLRAVRYEQSGRGHLMMGTAKDIVLTKDRTADLDLYILENRWVAVYSENRPVTLDRSEQLLTREFSGSISGTTLNGLGSVTVFPDRKINGRPTADLVVDMPMENTGAGQVFHLRSIYTSYAPKSVTGS